MIKETYSSFTNVSSYKKKYYSYSSCWKYALFLEKKTSFELVGSIIELCQTSPEDFWKQFEELSLTKKKYKKICSLMFKYLRLKHPIPYLTKRVTFNGLLFHIGKGIFIPQSDTEFLLEVTLWITNICFTEKEKKVLDLGTGCGNIAISLAKARPKWKITASDINLYALKKAKENALLNRTIVTFIRSNLFFKFKKKSFDLIISNPPYVSLKEYNKLSIWTKKQPRSALIASQDGLFFYRKILLFSSSITSKGFFVFEISPFIEKKVIDLVENFFSKIYKIKTFLDYNSNARVAVVWKCENKMLSYLLKTKKKQRFGSSVG